MREICCKFQYERSYDETASDNRIPESALPAFREFVKEIYEMGIPQKQAEKYQISECFVHVDCHWESVFVKDSQTAVSKTHLMDRGSPVLVFTRLWRLTKKS